MSASVDSEGLDVNLTPLLDLVLQLIMFFMITVNFVRVDQFDDTIKLPVASQAIPLDNSAEDWVFLNMNGTGQLVGALGTFTLDTPFQILAFFIMTYHPSALEGHIPGSLVPPDNFAKKSKDNNPLPAEQLLSIPEEDLLPELQEAITVKVKAIGKGQEVGSRTEGTP